MILFLIGLIAFFLVRKYIDIECSDYKFVSKKDEYMFYTFFLLLLIAFSYRYSLNIYTALFICALAIVINIAYIDLRYKVIPNNLILLLLIVALLNFVININSCKTFLLGGLFAFVVCFTIYKLSRFGGGDVKLLTTLSFLVGFSNSYYLLLFTFCLSAIVGIVLVLLKKTTLKSTIPLAPFAAIGLIALTFI